MTTTSHATRAEFIAHIADLAAQGYQFDASNVSDNNNTTFQPFVIAYRGEDTVYLRYNAMTEGTHETRRTRAFAAAAELIAAAQDPATTTAASPAAQAQMSARRATFEQFTQNATAAEVDATASALAANWTTKDSQGFKSILGTLQAVSEFGAEYYNAEARI